MTAPNEAGRVDVLAVMDDAALSQPLREDREDMRAARAAVAELIEADREYDEARAAANADDYGARKVYERLEAAQHRRAAALARCSGGAK